MAPADRIHRQFAEIAEPSPDTADPTSSSRTAPRTLMGPTYRSLQAPFTSLLATLATLINLFAWVYEHIVLFSFPGTLYGVRSVTLYFSHRFTGDLEGGDDIDPIWFYQPRGPGLSFHRTWAATMRSYADEWFLMSGASALAFTLNVAFLRQCLDIVIADPLLHALSLIALLASINAVWCDTVFFFFANHARYYTIRDAYHWMTGIVSCSGSMFFNIRRLPAVPAAATMWCFSSTFFFFIMYLVRVFGVPNASLAPEAGDMSYFNLPPVTRAVVGTVAALFTLHTVTHTLHFLSFGAIGMRAYRLAGIGMHSDGDSIEDHIDPSYVHANPESSLISM